MLKRNLSIGMIRVFGVNVFSQICHDSFPKLGVDDFVDDVEMANSVASPAHLYTNIAKGYRMIAALAHKHCQTYPVLAFARVRTTFVKF